MSTSITSDQLAKNVAATLLSMQKPGVYGKHMQSMNKSAAAALTALVPNWKALQEQEAFSKVYEAIIEANIASFKADYPEGHKEYNLHIPPLTENDKDYAALAYPTTGAKGIQGMSFLASALNSIRHGHHGDAVSNELRQSLSELEQQTISSLILHAKMYANNSFALPSIEQIAESITRLYAHGDFLFGMQAGAANTFRMLPAMASDPENNWGDDIFLALYKQGLGSPHMALPINKGELHPRSLSRFYKNSAYRITSDIPYPTQADADLVGAAAEYLRNRLTHVHLTDASGTPLEPNEKARAVQIFNNFANTLQKSCQYLRLESTWNYLHLPYQDAAAKIEASTQPTIDCLLVNQKEFPTVDADHHRRMDLTERVSALNNLIDKSGGRIIVVAPDSGMKEDQIRQVLPHAKISHYLLSQQDVDQLRYANIQTHTPVEMVIRQTLFNVFDAHSVTPQVPPQNVHDFAESFIHQLSGRIVGLNDNITDLLKDKIQTQAFRHGINYLAHDIKFAIPLELKSGLSVRSTDNPIPTPEAPAQPELRVARPR